MPKLHDRTKLPRRFRLPGGFLVTVDLRPRPSDRLLEDDDGDYSTETIAHGHITLWEGLTPRQRWRRFSHEMIHAFGDYAHWIDKET